MPLWIPGNAVGRVAGTAWVHLLGRSVSNSGAVGVITCQQLGQLGSVGWSVVGWLLVGLRRVGLLILATLWGISRQKQSQPQKVLQTKP